MAGLIEQNQVRGVEQRFAALEAGGGVSGGTGLLEPLTPRVDELTEIYTRYAFDKQYLNYLYLNNPVTLTVPPYLESTGKPDIEKSRFDLFYIYLPSNTLNVLTGEEAETPVLPGTPENGLFVGFGLIHGDGSYEVGTVGTENVIYVGKGGDNSKDGRSPENRVLDFTKAIELCGENNYYPIICNDSEVYNDTIDINLDVNPISIFAPNATFNGILNVHGGDENSICFKEISGTINIYDGANVYITKTSKINEINLAGTINASFLNVFRLTVSNYSTIYCSHIRGTFNYTDIETLTIKGRINDEQYPAVGHTIKDNGTAKTSRNGLNFKGFTVSDDPGNGNTDVEISKSILGLSNVDNTSDTDKPVSTATQTALNLKQNKALTTDKMWIGVGGVAAEIETANISIIDFSTSVLADEKYWRNNFNSSLIPAYAGQTVAGTGNLGTYMEVMAIAGGFVRVYSQPFIDPSNGYGATLAGLLQTSTGWVDGLKTITNDTDGRNGDISMKHKFGEYIYECIGRTGTGNYQSIWQRTQNKDAAVLTIDKGILFGNASGQAAQDSIFKIEVIGNLQVMKFGKSGFGYDSTTGEFGQMVYVQIAENIVKGEVLSVSDTVDNKYIKQTNEFDAVGVAAYAGSADGFIWVWKHGAICQALMEDGQAATRGYLAICAPTDGRILFVAVPSANPVVGEHFKEVGHCKESKVSGTNVLVLIDFHTL